MHPGARGDRGAPLDVLRAVLCAFVLLGAALSSVAALPGFERRSGSSPVAALARRASHGVVAPAGSCPTAARSSRLVLESASEEDLDEGDDRDCEQSVARGAGVDDDDRAAVVARHAGVIDELAPSLVHLVATPSRAPPPG